MRSTLKIFKTRNIIIASAFTIGFLAPACVSGSSTLNSSSKASGDSAPTSTSMAKSDSTKVIEGETHPIGNGKATSYVELDAEGKPKSLGIKFTKAALENLPQKCKTDTIPKTSFWEFCFGGKMNDALVTIFKTPPEAAATNVKTLELSWLPYGHAPEKVWDVPQFDIHFNFVTPTGGTDTSKLYTNPAKGELPEGYIVLPKSGFPWDTPAQKFHSHSANPQDSPEFKGGKFTTNFLYITYGGKVIGYEPYVALDYLQEKTSIKDYPIHKPVKYPKDGYYPSTMKIGLDEKGDYIIAIEGFKEYKASAK